LNQKRVVRKNAAMMAEYLKELGEFNVTLEDKIKS